MSWLDGVRRGRDQAAARWRAITRRRAGRILVLVGFALGLGLFARIEHDRLAAPQTPRTFKDTGIYFDIAAQPPSFDQLFGPKPLLTPAIFRALDREPVRIASTQEDLAFWAWAVLGVALLVCFEGWPARLLGGTAAVVFLLAPYRVGWCDAILSESINDSLMALAAAAAIGLATAASRLARGRRRTITCAVLAAVLAVLIALWVVARDSNAIVVVTAVAAAAVLWRVWRVRRADLWAPVLALAAAGCAAFALWTTRVQPTMPNGVRFQEGWDPMVTPRAVWPTIDNVFGRVLPDAEARAYFVDHGMPMGPDLMKFARHWAGNQGGSFLRSPELQVARHWIARHGMRVYLRWLSRHPIARADELVGHLWYVLGGPDLHVYMPHGWVRTGDGHPILGLLRGLSQSQTVLLALIVVAPLLLRRPRGHPVTGVALCMIASGAIGAAAAFYGDAYELNRHCYGAGQQIVLGLFLALIAWLDAWPRGGRPDGG